VFSFWCIARDHEAFDVWRQAVRANPDYQYVEQAEQIARLTYGHVHVLSWPTEARLAAQLHAAVAGLPETMVSYAAP